MGPSTADSDRVPGIVTLWKRWWSLLALAVVVAAGLVFRILVCGQALVGDEMSTFWIISHNSLTGVVTVVASDAEITPPLYFLAARVSSEIGSNPDLIRLPSMVAGIALIPIVQQIAQRLFDRRASLIAAAIASLSPLLVYFSANARAYSLMMLFLAGAVLTLLLAAEQERKWWLVAYAVFIAMAMYTHYTSIFVIGGLFLWAVWALPKLRLPLVLASIGGAVLFLPWLPNFFNDLNSPTTDILSALQAPTLSSRWTVIQQTVLLRTGTGAIDFFRRPDAILFVITLALTGTVLLVRRFRHQPIRLAGEPRVSHPVALAIVLTFSAPVGALVLGLTGTEVFGIREMATMWIGLPLVLAMLFSATGRTWAIILSVILLSGFTYGSAHLADDSKSGFAYKDLAAWIDGNAGPQDAILDDGHLTPSPSTPLDAYLTPGRPEYRLNLPEDRPDYIEHLFDLPDQQKLVNEAFSGDRRVFFTTLGGPVEYDPAAGLVTFGEEGEQIEIPRGWRVLRSKTFEGLNRLTVTEFGRS